MKKKYAELYWSLEDVQDLAPSLSDEAAAEWLSNNQNRLRDRLCELGWEVMQTLLECDGIPISEDLI